MRSDQGSLGPDKRERRPGGTGRRSDQLLGSNDETNSAAEGLAQTAAPTTAFAWILDQWGEEDWRAILVDNTNGAWDVIMATTRSDVIEMIRSQDKVCPILVQLNFSSIRSASGFPGCVSAIVERLH